MFFLPIKLHLMVPCVPLLLLMPMLSWRHLALGISNGYKLAHHIHYLNHYYFHQPWIEPSSTFCMQGFCVHTTDVAFFSNSSKGFPAILYFYLLFSWTFSYLSFEFYLSIIIPWLISLAFPTYIFLRSCTSLLSDWIYTVLPSSDVQPTINS